MEEMRNEGGEGFLSMASKDAWLVSGAILLGSIIVALAIVTGGNFGKKSEAGTAAQQGSGNEQEEVKVSMDQVRELFNGKNLTFGKKDSKVVFVEFSDPSCPYCHIAGGKNPALNKQAGARFMLESDGGTYVAPVPEMKKMVDEGKAAFAWVYQNGHGNGELGTKALYCANEKKKFWEVHDLLMSEAGYNLLNNDVKNDKTKIGTLADFLKSAVPANEMKTCLESGKYDGKLAEDMATAQSFGVSGTPGFFVNTDRFAGAYSFKEMQGAIDKYLK